MKSGYRVETVRQMRKAMSLVKKLRPRVIVTEFNFQSDFRDRTSSAESLLATVQRLQIDSKVIVLFEKDFTPQFERLKAAYPWIMAMTFPIDEEQLKQAMVEKDATR